jgi:RecB family exonuclease
MTAHAAKGLQWELVVVAGVQEGVWPDLRVRGGLLGAETLVDLVAGRDDSAVARQSARLAEERRLFYVATTRARCELVVTAVAADDTQPSRFLDDLEPLASSVEERAVERVPRGLDLASLVAELRRVVCDPLQVGPRRRGAARQLARLAAAGVRAAAPSGWYGLAPVSDDAPLHGEDEPVRVSPSRVDEFQRCELRWLLKACGASDGDTTTRARVGSLVHDLAERAAIHDWSTAQLLDEFDRSWPTLQVGDGWIGRREYDRVRQMVERLGRWLVANPRSVIAVEEAFDVEVGRARLVGRVDRLERDEQGRVVLVDLKTGMSPAKEEELAGHPQLAVYQLAVERGAFDELTGGERRVGGATLVQLGAPKGEAREQVQPPLTEAEHPAWAAELLAQAADGMAGGVFRAQRTPWCGYCPARSSCPAHIEGLQVTS